ncbi:MAG: NAD(P)H-hydrate dehydratase, partial [Kineosporiaceae bacterium]
GAVAALGTRAATGDLPRPERLLLTPHAGELAGLLAALDQPAGRAAVEADPAGHARRGAALTGATVLLKGATTVVASPGGQVTTVAAAPPWLATAGSGDVLSGVAGTLLAAGLPPDIAGPAAALLHGMAGQRAAGPGRGGPVPASALARAVREVVAGL